jgi:hypothetical protein
MADSGQNSVREQHLTPEGSLRSSQLFTSPVRCALNVLSEEGRRKKERKRRTMMRTVMMMMTTQQKEKGCFASGKRQCCTFPKNN